MVDRVKGNDMSARTEEVPILHIENSIMFCEKLLSDETDMQNTINTEHENYVGSEEEECFKFHEINIMRLEITIKCLKHLKYETEMAKGFHLFGKPIGSKGE